MEQENPKLATVQSETAASPITISYWLRDVAVYQVFDHEFQSIKSAASQSGLFLTFFGIAFGLMTALLIVLATVELTSPYVFAAFVVGFAASVAATVLLGIKAYAERKRAFDHIDYIEEQSRKRGAVRHPGLSSPLYPQDSAQKVGSIPSS